MHADDATSPRSRERLEWARAALGSPGAGLVRASMDAGFRSYWRSTGAGSSTIVMDSPTDQEDVRPWLRIRDLLEAGGVRVPRVLARDVEHGFLLLEDLGEHTLLQVIDDANADRMFDAALDQLLQLQLLAIPAGFPAYDRAMLVRELNLFDEWFLSRHLGIALDHDERKAIDGAWLHLVEAALAQPQVLVHRDFMPRNLMPLNGRPLNGRPLNGRSVDGRPVDGSPTDGGLAVLDFQDAVRGPIAYDPLSLFKDAFLSWPQARVDAWLGRYHDRASAAGLPVPELSRFRRDVDWIGVQRHLKVIGIFARLHHRDGKPKYLADVQRFFDYLDGVLPRYPEFADLRQLIETRVKPRMGNR
ncbi:MAG: phosphotransferase [Luteimonas sp.]